MATLCRPHVTDPDLTTPEYRAALSAFETGAIFSSSRIDLRRYLLAISQNVTGDDGIQARDIAQALTLNHLVLQRHIDELEKKSKLTTYLVIALTIASLAATAAQAWFAYKAEVRSEPEVKKQISTVKSDELQRAKSPVQTSAAASSLSTSPVSASSPGNAASSAAQTPSKTK